MKNLKQKLKSLKTKVIAFLNKSAVYVANIDIKFSPDPSSLTKHLPLSMYISMFVYPFFWTMFHNPIVIHAVMISSFFVMWGFEKFQVKFKPDSVVSKSDIWYGFLPFFGIWLSLLPVMYDVSKLLSEINELIQI